MIFEPNKEKVESLEYDVGTLGALADPGLGQAGASAEILPWFFDTVNSFVFVVVVSLESNCAWL